MQNIIYPSQGSSLGLNKTAYVAEVLINSTTWTLIPVSNNQRNHLWIQNQSDTEMKLHYNSAQAGYVGMILEQAQSANLDIKPTISIYAKTQSGLDKILCFMELT